MEDIEFDTFIIIGNYLNYLNYNNNKYLNFLKLYYQIKYHK